VIDVAAIARRGQPLDRDRLRRRLAVISGRGACRHPDGAVRFVASALRVFDEDVRRHLDGKRCLARSGAAVLPTAARR
jgi:NADH-ubiquinone oxidoreductase-F iron-sulfur binding region